MLHNTLLILCITSCGALYIRSSFWAPLFDRTVLNYRVDVPFDPESATKARVMYEQRYGYRGERLIGDFGNGKGPDRRYVADNMIYGEVTTLT